jgi:hypothetical protein
VFGDLRVAGKISPAAAASNNSASNAITLAGPLNVLGHTTLSSATVSGRLSAQSGDNAVTATIPQDLVAASLTVDSLTVKGSSKLGTGLRAGQLALEVKSLVTADQLSLARNMTVQQLDVRGSSRLAGGAQVGTTAKAADLAVFGAVTASGDLSVRGGAAVTGKLSASGGMQSSAVTLTGTLTAKQCACPNLAPLAPKPKAG